MDIRDDQLDALEATLDQPFEKARPERFGLRRRDAETDDLAAALGRNSHGDYCGGRDDAAAVANLQVSRVEPQIGPFAVERAVEKDVYSLIDVLAQFRNLALRDAGPAHGLHQLIDAAGRHATDPGLLDHCDQRLLGGLAGLQKGREV